MTDVVICEMNPHRLIDGIRLLRDTTRDLGGAMANRYGLLCLAKNAVLDNVKQGQKIVLEGMTREKAEEVKKAFEEIGGLSFFRPYPHNHH